AVLGELDRYEGHPRAPARGVDGAEDAERLAAVAHDHRRRADDRVEARFEPVKTAAIGSDPADDPAGLAAEAGPGSLRLVPADRGGPVEGDHVGWLHRERIEHGYLTAPRGQQESQHREPEVSETDHANRDARRAARLAGWFTEEAAPVVDEPGVFGVAV